MHKEGPPAAWNTLFAVDDLEVVDPISTAAAATVDTDPVEGPEFRRERDRERLTRLCHFVGGTRDCPR